MGLTSTESFYLERKGNNEKMFLVEAAQKPKILKTNSLTGIDQMKVFGTILGHKLAKNSKNM